MSADLSKPGPIRGGASKCEFVVSTSGSGGGFCGFRAGWWDGQRFLCPEHREAVPA